jgi:hypothetical protein
MKSWRVSNLMLPEVKLPKEMATRKLYAPAEQLTGLPASGTQNVEQGINRDFIHHANGSIYVPRRIIHCANDSHFVRSFFQRTEVTQQWHRCSPNARDPSACQMADTQIYCQIGLCVKALY